MPDNLSQPAVVRRPPVPTRSRSATAVATAAIAASRPLSSCEPSQPGPVQRLLLVVAGEQPEPDRYAGVDRHPGQPVGRGLADVVEVRRAAADHDSERDHRVVPRPGQPRPRPPAARTTPAPAPAAARRPRTRPARAAPRPPARPSPSCATAPRRPRPAARCRRPPGPATRRRSCQRPFRCRVDRCGSLGEPSPGRSWPIRSRLVRR